MKVVSLTLFVKLVASCLVAIVVINILISNFYETQGAIRRFPELINKSYNDTSTVTADETKKPIGKPYFYNYTFKLPNGKNAPSKTRTAAIDLRNLKVFIYNLPTKFNMDAIECLDHRPKPYTHGKGVEGKGCHYGHNMGYGKMLVNQPSQNRTVFSQCQHGLEVVLHNKLLRSPYRTHSVHEAHIFFVPYYTSLICFCQENVSRRDDEMWAWLNNQVPYKMGRPHFFAVGAPQIDLGPGKRGWSKGCHFLYKRHQQSFVKHVIIESADSLPDVIPVPRESYIHFSRPNMILTPSSNARPTFIFMAGKELGLDIRKKLKKQLIRGKADGKPVLFLSYELGDLDKVKDVPCKSRTTTLCLVELAQQSTFCLQPPGDTPTRKSFYDTLLSGCIPVIFTPHPLPYYPFQNLNKYGYPFNYDNFTVYIPEKEVTKQGRNIIDLLSAVSQERLQSLQRNLGKVAQYFQYGTYTSGEDAITMALRSLVVEFNLQNTILEPMTPE